MPFLRHEVEREHRVLAENTFRSSTNLTESHEQVQRDEPTATALVPGLSNKSSDRKSEAMRRRRCLVCLKPGHIAKMYNSSLKYLICGWRLCPDVRRENPTSPKDKVNNAKRKTSRITSELTSEEIQKSRLAVISIVRIEQ
ncbi:uncharacterized protein TNCV_2353461 [Trichonephila clavipes]|nr:uncharacterized protein TNCV_2353461 [Trichonephila clavipes]